MNKLISLVLFLGGTVLVVIGVRASRSFSSDVSNFFTGMPTDKAIWMIVGGAVVAFVGLTGTLRRPR
jgi:hypothetical protein